MKKSLVIVGIDPGFIKLGVAVINAETSELMETMCVSLRPEKSKLT